MIHMEYNKLRTPLARATLTTAPLSDASSDALQAFNGS